MKNYLNYDMLLWYSMFAILIDGGMDSLGGFWSSRLMHYIIMATLAYLIFGIVWWLVKHWKIETTKHRTVMCIWLIADALFLVMDILRVFSIC